MKLHLWRSSAILCALVLLVMTLGQKIGHRDGLVVATVIALSIIGLFLWYGDWRLRPLFKVKELEGRDPWRIRINLKALSDKARLPMPRVYIIPSEAPQAMAMGRSPNSAKILMTTGLIQLFSPEEVEAVLAYNLMCIKSRATVSFTIASALAEAILSFSGAFDWLLAWMFGSSRSRREKSFRPFTWFVMPLAAGLVRLAVGRGPYLRADRDAAALLGDGQKLAQILWKLQSYALTQPFTATPAAGHFFIVNPLTMNGLGRYFHAQPEVRQRIKNLVGHYPI